MTLQRGGPVLKVYVVTWEYPVSDNGMVAGVVGVAATPEGARVLAAYEAADSVALHPGWVVMIDNERFAGGAPADVPDRDWDLWLDIAEHEVQFSEGHDEPSVCLAGNPTVGEAPCGDPECVCAPAPGDTEPARTPAELAADEAEQHEWIERETRR